jgi:uncharacterized membrane protein
VLRFLLPLALLGSGVGSGVMLSTVMGTVPLTLTLPYEQYVRFIKFMWPRYDPFMPAVNALTFALDIALLITTHPAAARAWFAVAVALLATVMAISVIKNVPINRYVTSLDPGQPPQDWTQRDPRVRWRDWNLTRTLLALLALLANLAAAAALLT